MITQKKVHKKDAIFVIGSFRHFNRPRAVTNLIFFPQIRPIFLHTVAACSELQCNISNMGKYKNRKTLIYIWT